MNLRFLLPAGILTIVLFVQMRAGSTAAEETAPLPDRIFAYLDRNGDGVIDAEERTQIPVTMRRWLMREENGVLFPLKKAGFVRVFPTMMTELRKPKPVSPPTSAGNNAAPPLYASGTSPRVVETGRPRSSRVPTAYRDGDANGDGQIDFAEWRTWRPDELARFRQLDRNEDAILSPRELGAPPSTGDVAGRKRTSSSAGSSNRSTGSSQRSGNPGEQTGVSASFAKLSDDQKRKYREIIESYFEYLDEDDEGNKDGKLQESDWEASQRIKPIFAGAGIDLSREMTQREFVGHYLRLVPPEEDPTWKRRQKNPRDDDSRD